MYNRAEAVDKNFKDFVLKGSLPEPQSLTDISHSSLSEEEVLDIFESQIMSRQLDLRARELKARNLCYYTIGSSGHEGNAVFGKAFRLDDMAFLHYRSGAFFIQRAKQQPGSTPIYDMLLSFLASKDEPIAGGRHKVIGSKPLLIPPQTSTIASHLPKAVGAALSIGRAHDLHLPSVMKKDSLVLCSFGDASANHSTALGAINTANWVAYQNVKMPIVFICEDNGTGISVRTPENWIEQAFSKKPAMKYIQCDGLNVLDIYEKSIEAANYARRRKKPVFLHMKTVRLMGHAGSDVETSYKPLKQVEATEKNDPLLHTARLILKNNLMTAEEITQLYDQVRSRVVAVSEQAIKKEPLHDIEEIKSSITACTDARISPPVPKEEDRKIHFAREWNKLESPQHMAKLINWGLTDIMAQYPNTLIFGEDVAEKGGVYHVTDNLCKRFGSKRVFNSPLDEQSIIGTGIGLAHNGFVPIPEIQFLAYVHNAEDQIRGEAATLSFFSQGQFTNPMVLRIAGLAYQRGFGGHFHNDNSIAVFRDIPGLITAVPSNGADAVKMLRTCVRKAYEEGRVCVFIEPIARYMTRDLHKEGDKLWSFNYPDTNEEIPLGEYATYGEGPTVILTYGNGTYYSLQAQKELLEKHNIMVKTIDLRWISDVDTTKLSHDLKDARHILFVEECRRAGSLAEGIMSELMEKLKPFPVARIHAAEECFIPLGPAATAGLPSKESIVQEVLNLVKL